MQKKILRISWVAGLLLFVLLIYKIGLSEILANIKKLTLRHLLILLFLRLIFWMLRTLNWAVIQKQYDDKVSLWLLLRARLAGHAISYLTPTSHVGGEAIRALSIDSHNRKRNLASVIIDKTTEVMVMILFTILGVMILLSKTLLPNKYKLLFIIIGVAAILLVMLVLVKQKQGFFTWIISLLKKIRITSPFIEKNRNKIKQIDDHISHFYSEHKKLFPVVLLLYSGMILFWTWEIHVTLVYLGVPNLDYLSSFLIVTLGTLAFILPLFPGSLGTYEATYIAVFSLLGFGAGYGLSLTLIRRIIALFWAGIGLLLMALNKEKLKI